MTENTFGILGNHFRYLLMTMAQEPTQCHVDDYGFVILHKWVFGKTIKDQQMRRTTMTSMHQVPGGKIKFCRTLGDQKGATMLQLQPKGRESE